MSAASQVSQMTRELNGSDDQCGVFAESAFVNSASPLETLQAVGERQTTRENVDSRGLERDAYPEIDGIHGTPFDLPAWGTWFFKGDVGRDLIDETKGSAEDSQTGSFVSPEFLLNGEGAIAIWNTGGSQQMISFALEFSNSFGLVQRVDLPSPTGTSVWKLNEITVPSASESVRISAVDSSAEFGGWGAVTSPAVVSKISASDLLSDRFSYAGPFELTRMPCFRPPPARNGFIEKIDYVFDGASVFSLWMPKLLRVEVGCSAHLPTVCIHSVEYLHALTDGSGSLKLRPS